MHREDKDSQEKDKSQRTIEEQLAYINETIKESENEDSICSNNQEKPPTLSSETLLNLNKNIHLKSEKEDSESEIERRECDCCRVIPDEIINMNCVHNICVDCTLNVSYFYVQNS